MENTIKPNYKVLGPKFGKHAKEIGNFINNINNNPVLIKQLLEHGVDSIGAVVDGETIKLTTDDFIIAQPKVKEKFVRPRGEYYLHTPSTFTKRITLVGIEGINKLTVGVARCGYNDSFSKRQGIVEAKKKIAAGKVYTLTIPEEQYQTPKVLGSFIHGLLKKVMDNELKKSHSESVFKFKAKIID